MDFGTETMDVLNVPPTAVITAEQWAAIMDAVDVEFGELADKQAAKQYAALLVECGYDRVVNLQTAVARELKEELGIPLRWGMGTSASFPATGATVWATRCWIQVVRDTCRVADQQRDRIQAV